MGKVFSNGFAFAKGLWLKVIKNRKSNHIVGAKIRIFLEAEVRLYRKSMYCLYDNIKIDRGALVVSCPEGQLIIGDGVGIGPNNHIVCREKIVIGKETIIGPNVMIYDHDHIFSREQGVDKYNYKTEEIIIGERCWIGANSVILRGTHIGDNCLIAAGSVVKGNVPSGTIFIQKRESNITQMKCEK